MQHMPLSETDLQRQTLRLYGELIARRESWAGKFVFAYGEGASATGLPAAVSIAGGTTLALDPNPSVVKMVFRQGGVDFVVNTLDEALRVLKNEIRKHRPLSVALAARVQPTLAEMVERGVLPDLQVSINLPIVAPRDEASNQIEASEVGELEQVGMERLRLKSQEGIAVPSERLAGWLMERRWSEAVLGATTSSALREREMNAQLLMLLPTGDVLRRTWLQRIAHYQRPLAGGVRIVWLTEAERAVIRAGRRVRQGRRISPG
jgi:urocanate hydratase